MSLPNLLELAEQYQIDLNLRGNRYWGCCPFHEEITPSFSIDAEGRMFKCFGCGAGGGVLNFISLREGVPLEEVKSRYLKNSSGPLRSLESLQGLLKKCGGSREPRRGDIMSLIHKATEKAYSAWHFWENTGRKELTQQRSTSAYDITFHHLFTTEQQWEEFWEEFEEQVGDITWHANHGGFREKHATALMYLVITTPT